MLRQGLPSSVPSFACGRCRAVERRREVERRRAVETPRGRETPRGQETRSRNAARSIDAARSRGAARSREAAERRRAVERPQSRHTVPGRGPHLDQHVTTIDARPPRRAASPCLLGEGLACLMPLARTKPPSCSAASAAGLEKKGGPLVPQHALDQDLDYARRIDTP